MNLVAAAIKEVVPGAEVIMNLVPKEYAMSDIYCQLIPNDNESDPYYQVMPRMGAMEVSINGVVSELLSYISKKKNVPTYIYVTNEYFKKLLFLIHF